MTRIIIVPPPIILDLDNPDFCDGCLMSDEIPFCKDCIFCEPFNRRVYKDDDYNPSGKFPRLVQCKKAFLRLAREDETDRDAQEIELEIKEVTP